VRCVQQLRGVCRSIRYFPGELQQILNEIQILGEAFHDLNGLQDGHVLVGSSNVLQSSLAHCMVAKSALDAIVSRTHKQKHGNKKKQTLYSIKAVFRKEEIGELKRQLEESKSLLQLAMSCYSLYESIYPRMGNTNGIRNTQQRQTALLEIFAKELLSWKTPHEITPAAAIQTTLLPMPIQAQRSKASSRNISIASGAVGHQKTSTARCVCRLDRCFCSCHDSTVVSGKQWSIKYPRNSWWGSCNRKSCANFKRASLWIDLSQFGIHYAVLCDLEFMDCQNPRIYHPIHRFLTRSVDIVIIYRFKSSNSQYYIS
jgi:hypothetical protein